MCKLLLMNTRSVAVIVALAFVSPASAQAYTAKVEPSDEEYAAKRAAEATAQAQVKVRHKEEEQSKAANGANKPQEEKGQQESMQGETSVGEVDVHSCVVPSLKGESLNKARNVLRKHHCQLGKVLKLQGHRHGALIVMGQQSPTGKRLPGGARIGVTVGATAADKRRATRVSRK